MTKHQSLERTKHSEKMIHPIIAAIRMTKKYLAGLSYDESHKSDNELLYGYQPHRPGTKTTDIHDLYV